MKITIEANSIEELQSIVRSLTIKKLANAEDDTPITELGLIVRAENCLKGAGIKTLGDLKQFREFDLLKIPNLGRLTLAGVMRRLAELGVELAPPPTPIIESSAENQD